MYHWWQSIWHSIEVKQPFPQAKMLGKPTFIFFCLWNNHTVIVLLSIWVTVVWKSYFGSLYNWPFLCERSPYTFLNFAKGLVHWMTPTLHNNLGEKTLLFLCKPILHGWLNIIIKNVLVLSIFASIFNELCIFIFFLPDFIITDATITLLLLWHCENGLVAKSAYLKEQVESQFFDSEILSHHKQSFSAKSPALVLPLFSIFLLKKFYCVL